MRKLIAALALLGSSAVVQAQLPVALTYTCPTQTGSLPTCSTSYQMPSRSVLIIQYVSGSAAPINPNPTTGAFTTGQASMSVATQLAYEGGASVPNIIGPNYALAGSLLWFFTNPVTMYTDTVPVVKNNGGLVYLQGYLIAK